MKNLKFLTVLILLSFFAISNAQKADDVLGIWLSSDKDGQIEIFKKGNKYYGKLVWIKNPLNDDGSPKLDPNNPDENLRSRKRLGMVIMKDFVFDDDEWEDGTIYDPTSGSTYSAYMYFEDGNQSKLKLRGYVGVSLLGKTTVWTREKTKRISNSAP